MKKTYQWIPIGGLLRMGLVASLMIMPYNRKLTVSISEPLGSPMIGC